jgi:hypothetical protein
MTTTMIPSNPTAITTDELSDVEADLKAGKRLTVKDLAMKYGVKVAHMRSILVATYGNRIRFKRGRTGGIELIA